MAAPKIKPLEEYNDPDEFNYISLTFNAGGRKGPSCNSENFKETALDFVEDEFSNNIVAEYNKMIAMCREESEKGIKFSSGSVSEKAILYIGRDDNNSRKKPSSVYIDAAIASALNKYPSPKLSGTEANGASNAVSRCKGIARSSVDDYSKAFSPTTAGRVPPKNTIEYFDQIYKSNGLGSVKVDLADKTSLKNYLQANGINKGARIVCDVKEEVPLTATVIPYQVSSNSPIKYKKLHNGVFYNMDERKASDAALIRAAQEAIKNKEITIYYEDIPSTMLPKDMENIIKKHGKNINTSYVISETREYMYTGNNNGEPTFSRLTENGKELNIPLSELPITKTSAVVDHAKLARTKAEKALDKEMTLNPKVLDYFLPGIGFEYNVPKNMAASFLNTENKNEGLNNLQNRAMMVFGNIFNKDNPDIKALLTAKDMKDSQAKADNLAEARNAALKNQGAENATPTIDHNKQTSNSVTPPIVSRRNQGGRS